MKSPGHRANILADDISEIGVGFAVDDQTGATYWIQNLQIQCEFKRAHGLRWMMLKQLCIPPEAFQSDTSAGDFKNSELSQRRSSATSLP